VFRVKKLILDTGYWILDTGKEHRTPNTPARLNGGSGRDF
jgi:hypothetical protein